MTRAWSSEFAPRERAWDAGWFARKTTRIKLALNPVLVMNGGAQAKATVGLSVSPAVGFSGRVAVARPVTVAVSPTMAMAGLGVSKAAFAVTVNDTITMLAPTHVYTRTLPLTLSTALGMVGTRGPNFALLALVLNDAIAMAATHVYARAFDLAVTSQLGMTATPPVYARTLPVGVTLSVGMAGAGVSKAAFDMAVNDQVAMAVTHSYTNEFNIGTSENIAAGSDFEGAHPWVALTPNRTVVSTDQAYRGTKSLAFIADGTATYATATLRGQNGAPDWNVTPGDRITVSYRARRTADFSGVDCKIRIGNLDNGNALVSAIPFDQTYYAADAWVLRTSTFLVPDGMRRLSVTAVSNATAGTAWLDEIEIRRHPNYFGMATAGVSAAAFNVGVTLGMAAAVTSRSVAAFTAAVTPSVGMAVTSRSGPATFRIGPTPNSATDPDTDIAAAWVDTTNRDPITLVTDGPAALGPVMLKVLRANANSYAIAMPVRNSSGRGTQDYDVVPGQRTTLTVDVARVPGSPGGNVSVGIFVRHINSAGQIMSATGSAVTASSLRTDDTVTTLTASAVAPEGAQRIDAGVYLTQNTQPVGDGYYASNFRYVKEAVSPVIGMAARVSMAATVGLAVTPTVGMVARHRVTTTLPLVINDTIGMAGAGVSRAAFDVVVNDTVAMVGREAYTRSMAVALTAAMAMAGREAYTRTLALSSPAVIGMFSGQVSWASFSLAPTLGVGMAGRELYARTFDAAAPAAVAMGGTPRHGVQFSMSVTPAVGMAGRNMVTTTLPLVISDTIDMLATPRHGAQFTMAVTPTVGVTATPRHGAQFNAAVTLGVGMAARHQVNTTLPMSVTPVIGMQGTDVERGAVALSVTPTLSFTADLRQVKFGGTTGFVDNNGSVTTSSIGPFNGPSIPAGRGALVVCVAGYRTSSAVFNSLDVDYNGVTMTPVGPIVWVDNSATSNSGFLRWFILTGLAADRTSRPITINWAANGFMSPYWAIRAISFSGVAGYGSQVSDGGTETGTALSQSIIAAQQGSRLLHAFAHEPIAGDVLPSNYAVSAGAEFGTLGLRTTNVAGKGIMSHVASGGAGVVHTYTAERASGADYLECGFELLPI